jgi:type I restriction enzyme S subunit
MTLELLFPNFDQLIRTPEDVQRLNETILQLAVQGKLVPQDPQDEPASELLRRIEAEKAKMSLNGRMKLLPSPKVDLDSIPTGLPQGWTWVSLKDAGIINPRNEAPDDLLVSFVPMQMIKDGIGSGHTAEERTWREIRKGFTHFAEGDVGVAKVTPCFQNRKSTVFRDLSNGIGAGTTELHIFRPVAETIVPEYVLYFFQTPNFVNTGVERMTGTAGQQRVPKEYVEEAILPLPPLAEQRRIVAKVDQLFAQTRALEAKLRRAQEEIVVANRAALHRLHTAADDEAFHTAWRTLADHFDLLYDDPRTVADLRQTLLDLAVRGKLVPQDPHDEPASELLRRITEERRRLATEGVIGNTKSHRAVTKSEMPFGLPPGWVWCRLGEAILEVQTGPFGSTLHKSDYVEKGIPVVNPANIQDGTIVALPQMTVSVETRQRLRRYVLQKGDIVMGRRGEMGRCALVSEREEGWLCGSGSFVLKTSSEISHEYLVRLIRSPMSRAYLSGGSVGTTMSNLNHGILNKMVIALPPLAEQRRIVAKVDQLLRLCDELEARLRQGHEQGRRLAAAVLRGVG